MGVTRAQKVRLGLFVAGAITLGVAGIVALAGSKLGEVRDAYQIRYDQGSVSLSGLEVGSPVKYSGIKVGRVDAVGIDPQDVSVIVVGISLQGGTPVSEQSVANLGSQGITGLKYVELTRGERTGRLRAPGESIPAGASSLDQLTDQAERIAMEVQATLVNVRQLTDADMRARIGRLMERTDSLIGTLEATVNENRTGLAELTAAASGTTRGLATLATELTQTARSSRLLIEAARPPLTEALTQAGGLVGELRTSRQGLDDTVGDARALVADGRAVLGPEGVPATLQRMNLLLDRTLLLVTQSREDLVDSANYLREAAANFSDLSRQLREDPSLLLMGDRGSSGE